MICFEVFQNGQIVCNDGFEQGAINLLLFQTSVSGLERSKIMVTGMIEGGEQDMAPKLRAAVQNFGGPPRRQRTWIDRDVEPGDEFTIRIVDRPASDP